MVRGKQKKLKIYYSISEVAEMFGVNTTLLRYWETQFPQLKPKKTDTNHRMYTEKDIEEVKIIHNLVKVRGLRLEAAAEILKRNREGVEQKQAAIDELRKVLDELKEIKRIFNELY